MKDYTNWNMVVIRYLTRGKINTTSHEFFKSVSDDDIEEFLNGHDPSWKSFNWSVVRGADINSA